MPHRMSVGGATYNSATTPAIIFNNGVNANGFIGHNYTSTTQQHNTGIYSDAQNKIQVSIAGTKRFQVDTAGVDVIGSMRATDDVVAFFYI